MEQHRFYRPCIEPLCKYHQTMSSLFVSCADSPTHNWQRISATIQKRQDTCTNREDESTGYANNTYAVHHYEAQTWIQIQMFWMQKSSRNYHSSNCHICHDRESL